MACKWPKLVASSLAIGFFHATTLERKFFFLNPQVEHREKPLRNLFISVEVTGASARVVTDTHRQTHKYCNLAVHMRQLRFKSLAVGTCMYVCPFLVTLAQLLRPGIISPYHVLFFRVLYI